MALGMAESFSKQRTESGGVMPGLVPGIHDFDKGKDENGAATRFVARRAPDLRRRARL
jgi:hypothetical protein